MIYSNEIDKIALAMVNIQGEVRHALKDSKNQYFTTYANLENVWDAAKKPLQKYKVAVIQIPHNMAGTPSLSTMLLHESGQYIQGNFPFEGAVVETEWESKGKNYKTVNANSQETGKALTYLRRYAFAAMVGVIAGDDDDGESSLPQEGATKEEAREEIKINEPNIRTQLIVDLKTITGKDDPAMLKLKLIQIGEELGHSGADSVKALNGQKLIDIANNAASQAEFIRGQQ